MENNDNHNNPTKTCNICNIELTVDNFGKRYKHIRATCYGCCRKRSNDHNNRIKEKIKEASGDCWWIEMFCTSSYYYTGKPKIKK